MMYNITYDATWHLLKSQKCKAPFAFAFGSIGHEMKTTRLKHDTRCFWSCNTCLVKKSRLTYLWQLLGCIEHRHRHSAAFETSFVAPCSFESFSILINYNILSSSAGFSKNSTRIRTFLLDINIKLTKKQKKKCLKIYWEGREEAR